MFSKVKAMTTQKGLKYLLFFLFCFSELVDLPMSFIHQSSFTFDMTGARYGCAGWVSELLLGGPGNIWLLKGEMCWNWLESLGSILDSVCMTWECPAFSHHQSVQLEYLACS